MEKQWNSVAIVHHSYTMADLVEEELLTYVLPRTQVVYYMTHPFRSARDRRSLRTTVDTYYGEERVNTYRGPRGFGPEIFYFIKDAVVTLLYFLVHRKTEIYIGVDNLNAFVGIMLRRLGKTRQVVYYVIDYVPMRFENRWLNALYHWVERYCVCYADETWNVSPEMERVRAQRGLPETCRGKQRTVPIGCHSVITSSINTKKDPHTLRVAFLGVLSPEQGIDLFFEQIPLVLRSYPGAHVVVIGSGALLQALQLRSRDMGLVEHITFTGFIKEHKDVMSLLTTCDVGIAPYPKQQGGFKPFADPAKVKMYLGAGLPVVMTRISHIASVVEDKRAGVIVEDVHSIAEAVVKVISDRPRYQEMRANAITLGREYEWEHIFASAFTNLAS